jgi:hypothetical protein
MPCAGQLNTAGRDSLEVLAPAWERHPPTGSFSGWSVGDAAQLPTHSEFLGSAANDALVILISSAITQVRFFVVEFTVPLFG